MNARSVKHGPQVENLVEVARQACADAAGAASTELWLTRLDDPPIAPLEAAAAALRAGLAHPHCFYASADRRETFFALGAARSLEVQGPGRFAAVADWWRETLGRCPDPSDDGFWPMALGGFSFSDRRPATGRWAHFPAAFWMLPSVLVAEHSGRSSLVLCGGQGLSPSPAELLGELFQALEEVPAAPPEPELGGGMSHDTFTDLVAQAKGAIGAGRFRKVVLARARELRSVSPGTAAEALLRLPQQQPGCRVFALSRGDSVFLGASPERLVRVSDGVALVDCLAGSAPRGSDPITDDRLAADLLTSVKDREEHQHVVQQVGDVMHALGLRPEIPDRPGVVRFSHVQHLSTPVRAALTPKAGLFELAGALHPTPAVGGAPGDAALDWLQENGALDRGWYTGAIGWVGAAGGGELAVAIRCALIGQGTGEAFAGCGIVGASDPEREFEETENKLGPILRALGVRS